MTLDLSQYDCAEDAAKALYKHLIEDQDAGESCVLHDPDDNPQTDCWAVSWEGGPYQWANALIGGSSLYARELRTGADPEVTGWYDQDDWMAEPYFSFDLQFYNEQ